MKKTTTKKRPNQVTNYTRVSNNIYFDGTSYRVRASIDGTKYSKNFPSKTKAMSYRKTLLASA
jgi:hypothetical protein